MGRRGATAALAALAGGAVVASRSRRRSGKEPPRWLVVTINRSQDEVAPDGRLPDPLVALGDKVDIEVRPASGTHGTELAARPRKQRAGGPLRRLTGTDPRQDVRRALRESKQLIEIGEVVRANEPGTTKRTLLGIPIDIATRRAGGEGRL